MSALDGEQCEKIAREFEAYLQSSGIAISVPGKQSGFGAQALQEFIAGTYALRADHIALAVKKWMTRDKARATARPAAAYVSTEIAERIRAVCYLADRRAMMGVVIAPSGSGKTFILQAMAREMSGVYMSVGAGMTPKEFLMSLAALLGRRETSGSRGVLHRWLVKNLEGTRRPIFLDEAHKLGRCIDCIRQLFDETGCTIIMAGTLEIMGLVDDRADGAGQFASRTICFNALEALGNSGDPGGGRFAGKPLFSVQEVEDFLASRKVRLSPDALRLAWSLACLPGFGSLRLVEHAAGVAMDLTPGLEVIERVHLVAALKLLHGIEFGRMEQMASRMRPVAPVAAVG